MPVMLVPTRDVIPIGVEHSSLQPLLQQAAADTGVELSPDPLPQESIFIRSDQYAFIRTGVPAVFLLGGLKGGEGADRQLKDFLHDHYHEPSDDASQPIQYADAARLARLNARIGQRIADAAQRRCLEQVLDTYDSRVAPTLGRLRHGVIHNDANDWNLLVADPAQGAIAGLIDFGDAAHSPLIAELAVGCCYAMLDEKSPIDPAAVIAAGY
ncbi:phosphotransferase, partial [Lysobacter sp. 2RAB21]